MSNVIEVLSRRGVFFLFLVLELICFYLIIQYNAPQRVVYDASKKYYSDAVNNRWSKWLDFLSLEQQNQQLQEENARLKELLPNAQSPSAIEIDTVVQDSLNQRFVYTAGRVVAKSAFSPQIVYTIDRGHIHGIEPHQGVIGNTGVVGVVTHVSSQHARVMSLLHNNFKLSAGLRNKPEFGTLTWDGRDARFAQLNGIPEYADAHKGDTIETTGYSSIFPTGIPVGIISNVKSLTGENNYLIQVKLFEDYFALKHVYVIRNLEKEDLEALEQTEQ